MGLSAKCRSVNTGSGTMDYMCFGRGETPLVIIPGLSIQRLSSATAVLMFMYREFLHNYRVYIFDKPDEIPLGCSIAGLAGDTARAMRVLGIENAHVLGVSMGGMIAQQLALEQPSLVRSLVLALTLSRNNSTVEKAVGTWIELVEKGDYPAFINDMFQRMYSPAYLRRYRFFLPVAARFSRPADTQRFVRLARACLSCETYERLGEIRCPVFVIGARLDAVVSAEASVEISERLGCRLHMYEDLGHAAYDEAKDFNSLVLNFFKNA